MTSNLSNHSQWVTCPKPNRDASVRLFCFPYSGAGPTVFYPWANVLPVSIEVCPIQYPGRGTRLTERLITNLMTLAEQISQNLLPYLDKPYAFFGHSLGAVTSFEVARNLRRLGAALPLQLFASGHAAPQVANHDAPLHKLHEDEFRRQVERLNGMPAEMLANQELMDFLIPILRGDFTACETYIYYEEEPLTCPVFAFGGLKDFDVPRSHLEAWKEQTSSLFSVRMFPGDHFFLNSDRHLLLEALARDLAQTMGAKVLR